MTSYEQIRGNLVRQEKGMQLLLQLLEEEFSLLQTNSTDDVVALEFSIHELLRQLADERMAVKAVMQDTRLAEYAEMLEPEEGAAIKALLRGIDDAEQKSARQAGHNTRLSLALLDQSQGLLDYLQDQVAPKSDVVYGRKGAFRTHRSGPSILSGRA
ncbi:FlgN family protein [uncultured delta proteobacterium]|uniref:FlgN family protein n=1 Tax=uncultured delta proteobacterium TaxID=34034 RepID=A0A212JLV5_9DELT|nr:FlgN family protein [uncultured delta proteobacterium]